MFHRRNEDSPVVFHDTVDIGLEHQYVWNTHIDR